MNPLVSLCVSFSLGILAAAYFKISFFISHRIIIQCKNMDNLVEKVLCMSNHRMQI